MGKGEGGRGIARRGRYHDAITRKGGQKVVREFPFGDDGGCLGEVGLT